MTSYNLKSQNKGGEIQQEDEEDEEEDEKLTEATQPEFIKQVNEKLVAYLMNFVDNDVGMKIKTEGNVDDDDDEPQMKDLAYYISS